MYGPSYEPAPPPRDVPASVIVLRVLFALLPLLSIGFLTWATMVRLAVVTRRALDWVLCGVSVAVLITGIVLMPDDIETARADMAVGLVLLNAAAFTVYFLVVDIRHDRNRVGPSRPPYPPYATTVPRHQTGYGYPPAYPQPQSQPQPHSQTPPQPQPQTPPPLDVPPQANPRIDQVRAELDELSDLLRKEEGR